MSGNILYQYTNRTLLNYVTRPQCCACAVRYASNKYKTRLPKTSAKGTAMVRSRGKPEHIGMLRSWYAKHTGGLKGSYWAAERFIDDIMITEFIEGVFYELLLADVVIKRRLNEIIIAFFVTGRGSFETTRKIYYLKAFSETLLTEMMGCIVRLEIATGVSTDRRSNVQRNTTQKTKSADSLEQ